LRDFCEDRGIKILKEESEKILMPDKDAVDKKNDLNNVEILNDDLYRRDDDLKKDFADWLQSSQQIRQKNLSNDDFLVVSYFLELTKNSK